MIMNNRLTVIEMLMTAQVTTMLTKITNRTVVGHPAAAQYDGTIQQAAEGADVVQHDQNAGARRQQSGQHVSQCTLMLEVDARSWLVQHQEIWSTGKGSGNKDALLLPTGQRGNVGIELIG